MKLAMKTRQKRKPQASRPAALPQNAEHETSFRALDEIARRHSKSQEFRSLGDELSGHEPFVILAGIIAAFQPTDNPANNDKMP